MKPVEPEDILPEGADFVDLAGRQVRKGSVAAFVANVRQLAVTEPDTDDFATLVAALRQLVPALQAAGVFEVFQLKSGELNKVLGV